LFDIHLSSFVIANYDLIMYTSFSTYRSLKRIARWRLEVDRM